MSMPVRSERSIVFDLGRTPAKVGPGRYGQRQQGVVPSYAGFASTNARVLNANKTTSAITPGPGTYTADHTRALPSRGEGVAVNTSFKSTISRIGPTSAGATPFQEPTSYLNPGPGHYDTGKGIGSKTLQAAMQKIREERAPVVAPARKAPAIPRRDQCFGYEPGPRGTLVAQPAPDDIYSGLGVDTVGPAFYNPRDQGKKGTLNMARASQRKTEFDMPKKSNTPGPGHYDPGASRIDLDLASQPSLTSQLRKGVLAKRRARSRAGAQFPRKRATESAVFKSKTPMCHERKEPKAGLPGPGAYLTGRKRRHRRGARGFGSTTRREGWARDPSMPFTDPDTIQTPGPGSYGRKSLAKAPSLLSLQDDAPQVPFASTDERPCLRYDLREAAKPGPGAYDTGQLNLLSETLRQKTHGKPGNFGADSGRFPQHLGISQYATVETPGPGYYNAAGTRMVSAHRRMRGGAAVFKSTSSRFKGEMRSNTHTLVGKRVVPPPTKYNAHRHWGSTAPARAQTAGGVAPFTTRQPRFRAATASATPGPGSYEPERSAAGLGDGSMLDGRQSAISGAGSFGLSTYSRPGFGGAGVRSQSSFGARQNRFHTDVHNYLGNARLTPAEVGPGRYNLSGSFVKKSYNITMTR